MSKPYDLNILEAPTLGALKKEIEKYLHAGWEIQGSVETVNEKKEDGKLITHFVQHLKKKVPLKTRILLSYDPL